MRNSENNFTCERESEMLAYLYGEAEDRTTFESHLVECDACTDEFAAIAFARVSVLEWQLGEFAELPTPKFTIPYEKAGQRAGLRAAIGGWFALPGFGPAVAFAALLVMVIGGYLAFFNNGAGNAPTVAAVDTISPSQVPVGDNAPSLNISVPSLVEPLTKVQAVQKHDSAPAERPVKASVAQRGPRVNRALTAKVRPRQIKVETAEEKKPVLSSFDEEDDKTLRLADLVDDDGV